MSDTVKVKLCELDIDDDYSIIDFMKRFQEAIEQVPEEYKDTTRVIVSSGYESSSVYAELYYNRPKTWQELDEEKQQREQWRLRKIASDLEQLKELTEKYKNMKNG